MRKAVLLLLLFASVADAQVPFGNSVQGEKFRKEMPSLQSAINEVINNSVPGIGLLAPSKATYLEGYGVVVTLEVSLEPTRNPFSSAKTPAEVRTIVTQRRKEIKDKLVALLRQRVTAIESVGPAESVSVIVHLLNTNPADVPDVPSQLVLTVKKQQAVDAQAGRIADAASLVSVREF